MESPHLSDQPDASASEGSPSRSSARSTTEILRSLSRDVTVLFRKEAALLRAELREKVDQAGSGVRSLGAGALIAFAGFLVLLDAAVYGLARVVEPFWLSAVIVGGGVALVGLALLARARSHLRSEELAPEHAAATMRKDADFARSHGEDVRSKAPGMREPPGARSA